MKAIITSSPRSGLTEVQQKFLAKLETDLSGFEVNTSEITQGMATHLCIRANRQIFFGQNAQGKTGLHVRPIINAHKTEEQIFDEYVDGHYPCFADEIKKISTGKALLNPPKQSLALPDPNAKKTLGQIAFEADRENAIRETPGLVDRLPTWESAAPFVRRNWENIAKRVAEAIAKEAREEVNSLRGKVIDLPTEEK